MNYLKDNSDLLSKSKRMAVDYPWLSSIFKYYKNLQSAKGSYSELVMRKAMDTYGIDWTKLPEDERNYIIEDIYSLSKLYWHDKKVRLPDDPGIKFMNDYNTAWLAMCIDEAIEECVIKVLSEPLVPPSADDAFDQVNMYLELKLSPVWIKVEKCKSGNLYINKVGDYYDINTNKIRKSYINSGGYKEICYKQENGSIKSSRVHRDVAFLFIHNPDPINYDQVNHLNGVKTCNAVFNLEWTDQQGNVDHASKNLLLSHGEDHLQTKYTDKQVEEICIILRDRPDISFYKIEEMTGMKWTYVRAIYHKSIRRTVTEKYNFPPRETVREYSDDDIRLVCRVLCEHPEWTYAQMEEYTNVDDDYIEKIYNHHVRCDISADYEFPRRESHLRGVDNLNCVCTEEQIRHICELLRDRPDLSFPKVAEITHTPLSIIGQIYRRVNWVHISKEYEFPPRESRYTGHGEDANHSLYTNEQIERVCCMIDDKVTGKNDIRLRDIAKATGVSLDVVKGISRCKGWRFISENHIFYKMKMEGKAA